MSIVKVEKSAYTVEPLHQWDLNQVLEVRGLSLARVPEVHFTNQSMDRAIVRQASMDSAGVIKVNVPNSLLQKPYDLKVYICGYTGATFETYYTLDVPVKPREMPYDYTITDDPEVYSFTALENAIANAQQALLNSQQALLNAQKDLKNTLATIDTTVNTEVAEQLQAILDTTLSKEGNAAESKATGEAIAARAQVVYGTYVGTGTFGADNPNTLTADFDIKLALVYENNTRSSMLLAPKGLTSAHITHNDVEQPQVLTWDGNIFSWYYNYTGSYDGSPQQLNENGTTYHYILIG